MYVHPYVRVCCLLLLLDFRLVSSRRPTMVTTCSLHFLLAPLFLQSVPVFSFNTTPSSSALSLLLLLAQLLLLGSSGFDRQQQEHNQDDIMDKVELGVTSQLMFQLGCQYGRSDSIEVEGCGSDGHYVIEQLQLATASEMGTECSSSLQQRMNKNDKQCAYVYRISQYTCTPGSKSEPLRSWIINTVESNRTILLQLLPMTSKCPLRA